jgi:branched-chain amino acid transport system ATP-binding protein
MLKLIGDNITKSFGGVSALREVKFEIEETEIIGLIGPNGAGKTTLFNIIAGVYHPDKGNIYLNEENITKLNPSQLCKKGIARTFQIPRPFLELTCIENIMVSIIGRKEKISTNNNERIKEARKYLKFVDMTKYENTLAKNLTLIQKKKLEVARALSTKPKIILLDEVFAGLNSAEIRDSVMLINRMKNELGLTQFWIEHVMGVIMEIAERIIVLDNGTKISEGKAEEVAKDTRVIEAYLGDKDVRS